MDRARASMALSALDSWAKPMIAFARMTAKITQQDHHQRLVELKKKPQERPLGFGRRQPVGAEFGQAADGVLRAES
jgi:hypothetical protein